MDDVKTRIARADEALLADLGYKQEFKRAFTPLEVFGIAFSIIGLLPSIASVLTYSIPNGGPSAMVWGWAVASVFILFVGMSMAELAAAAPTSGGLYFWTYTYSSPRCRNLLCWIVGYANTIGSIASVASINWGAAVQVMAAASIGAGYEATNSTTFAVYALITVSHAFVCCLGTRLLARLQSLYVVLNILLSVAIIVALPAATPTELRNSASFALGKFTNQYDWPDGYAFILSFLAPLWVIGAFDSSVHISEEASNAATAVPWAIVWAILISGVLGTAINIAIAFCMGTDLDALFASEQPMALIFLNSFGRGGTLAVWAFVVAVQCMLAASRQSFAFSRDGALPFSARLYRMNAHTGTPVNTVLFTAAGALVLGLLGFAGDQATGAIFALSIVGLYVAYSVPIAVRWVWRRENGWADGPFSLGVFSLPCAVIAVLWMTFTSIVFLFPTTKETDGRDMNYTVVVLGGTLLLSLAWYYCPKYGGVHWFRGPVATGKESAEDVKGSAEDVKEDVKETEVGVY
ncbi:APC amino acid permease [Amylostereum chailletii]|nr:APC amino acid permease [Amylostereum chailletii]